MGIGTVISFMMRVTTLSIPSLVMLSKVVKPKLLTTFIIISVIGIMIVGYGLNASIEKVTDIKEIMKYGVMQTPALVVDEKLKIAGKVPSIKKIKDILKI